MSTTHAMPLSSSSYYSVFTVSAITIPLLRARSLKVSSSSSSSSISDDGRANATPTTVPNPSRRLALFQLGAGETTNPIHHILYFAPSSDNSLFLRCNNGEFCTLKSMCFENPAIPQSHLLGLRAVEKAIAEEKTPILDDPNALLEWIKNDKRRMLHVVYRVGDLDKTIKFYTECLGMKLLRQRDIPEDRYRNAFLGYGPEESNFAVELTYNYGVDKYDIGSGFGHFGIAVDDVGKAVNLVKAKGGRISPVKGGNQVIAFVKDPDGYNFELLKRKPAREPLCQVMLRVGDLDQSINFYKKAFGMELLSKRDYPNDKYTVAYMGYGPEDNNVVLELTYNYGINTYDKGNGYAQIAIGTDDVYKSAEAIKLCGGAIVLEPGPLPGINTKITVCLDPEGWKWVFVDNGDFLRELE
ncbi:unnamed protein product [Linum tenue]|uniref:lactoylglutathione lyase n=1 Tax=Linum tenue TaxID=586396 RepID=A0AAV0JJS2_9ROSI|nr:unnamed protein product [Linum tenue]